MKTVWEKRPGRWKVSGESKVFPTKEEAIEWAATLFEVVEPAPEPAPEPETDWLEEELIAEEEVDPLEALKQARINNGSIEEGSYNDGDHEEQ